MSPTGEILAQENAQKIEPAKLIAIDQCHGFVRGFSVTSAAAWDGAQLPDVLNKSNTGSKVWADTAYRSAKNEQWLEQNG